ncbi:hypothetical protein psyc5s11_29600 [Clostridium gelidum]|uniref:Uncharacterized protein n=1 Tax=Clostridium gelidum TaxID=704125 RepID=A0ABM7T4J6_9CLOT|nr:hypothetical protein [Clostridium gelidum]BCZ46893.1 hypothetical protein psyc5s11_29600 [Clostridium gelidum]
MKKYMKNKDFIPEKFYDKIEVNKNKTENRIFTLFLIINLLLIPFTTKSMSEIKEKPIDNKSAIYDSRPNKINSNDIKIWIENMLKDEVEEAYIANNNGEVVVNDIDKIDELSLNSLIKISDVNLNSNGKYKLGVSLNE